MTNQQMKVAAAAATLIFTSLPSSAWAVDLKAPISINIAAQYLEAALLELSKQGHIQLVISTESLPNTLTEPVSGSMSLGAALDLLLTGSGLSYVVVGKHTLAIVKSVDAAKRTVDPQAPAAINDSVNFAAVAPSDPSREAANNKQ